MTPIDQRFTLGIAVVGNVFLNCVGRVPQVTHLLTERWCNREIFGECGCPLRWGETGEDRDLTNAGTGRTCYREAAHIANTK